jgi:hypothetical protein
MSTEEEVKDVIVAKQVIRQLTEGPREEEVIGEPGTPKAGMVVGVRRSLEGTKVVLENHSAEYWRAENALSALRDLMISIGNDESLSDAELDEVSEATEAARKDVGALYVALRVVFEDEYSRDEVTEMAMSMSLCPIHFVDWAICFDDEDPECDQVRAIFPHCHDT